MDSKRIGKSVLDARLAANYSQEDLARRADLASSYISKLERGLIARPSLAALTAVSRALSFDSLDAMLAGGASPSIHERTGEYVPPHAAPAGGPTPSYAVAIPVVAVANAGRGGGTVEEWAFMPFEDTQGRSLRAYRASGVCMEPHVNDGDTVIVDTDAAPQEGQIVAAFNLETGDFLIKWYSRRNGEVELRPEQGEPILLPADRIRIEGVVIQVNRKAPRRRR